MTDGMRTTLPAPIVLYGLLLTATSWPLVLTYSVSVGAMLGWKNLGGQGL